MSNTIQLYSVYDLLERDFFIPSYQRGYRWTKQQVVDLLDDILAFANKTKKENEFYCLQPIVVKKHTWKRGDDGTAKELEGYEVVDGQQRLTTLRILFTYLIKEHLNGKPLKSEYKKDIFNIDYETRAVTEDYFNNILECNDNQIDLFHISAAYKYIREWFEEKNGQRDVRESVIRTLVYPFENQKAEGVVQVIWYEITNEVNPIDTFIRINLGKISLTNAELIKALFLQERNFGEEAELAKLRQLEIANEWDKIENTLQEDDFWWFLNERENHLAARIEYIFDIMRDVDAKKDPGIVKEIGTDRFATFRYFYRKLDKMTGFDFVKDQWAAVTDYFNRFQEWYNNPVWYHYIGFLIYCGRHDISTLYELTSSKSDTKEAITQILMGKIRQQYTKVEWTYSDDDPMTPFLNLSYSKDKKAIRELLLLFNITYIVKQCISKSIIFKFPFRSFKEESWDVEHIDSFTENALRSYAAQKVWLESSLESLPEISQYSELYDNVQNFIRNEGGQKDFDSLHGEVIILAKENSNHETLKDNIGNLTLLDAGTNRAYGNALFPTKRRTIIEKDKNGVFIPICTKNVFLKYFDLQGKTLTKWTEQDIKTYRNVLAETLIDFLPTQPQ
ncbi:MAG: DUF262 domain-containing protein [Chitinophaga sp.]|uniref:DUF262 domain-containing protein n=1 Tax=Chitinophaga sp. TaxID=1869181 RepID=UPI0025BE8BB8|nr:DUF262 domain-containing protein [Chitinophaga sp.]MBV8252329.1 DUF262 domain-containing protein [Chitinophaga sp.]